jgi:CO dehydrogenase maturation factor
MTLKIAIGGKGGVGKTTLTCLLAWSFSRKGAKVLVIDADPSPNLAQVIGVPKSVRNSIVPIAEMRELIEERTGVPQAGQTYGMLYKLNPQVDDLMDRFAINCTNNINLLALGAIRKGGSGCYCPESALLRNLLKHIVLTYNEVLLVDLGATVEYFSRRTAEHINVLLCVIEPNLRSVGTAAHIQKLGTDIGITKIGAVLNKIKTEMQRAKLETALQSAGLEIYGSVPYVQEIEVADLEGEPHINTYMRDAGCPKNIVTAIEQIRDRLLKLVDYS